MNCLFMTRIYNSRSNQRVVVLVSAKDRFDAAEIVYANWSEWCYPSTPQASEFEFICMTPDTVAKEI